MAIDHDGVDDVINAATLGTSVASRPFSLASMFWVDSLAAEQSLGGASGSGGDYNAFSLRGDQAGDPTGAFTLDSGINSAWGNSASTSAATGTWYHGSANFIAIDRREATFQGSAGTENGVSVNCSNITSVTPGTFRTFLDGRLAQFGAWTVNLGPADYNALTKGFTPQKVRPDKCIAWFPLIRSTQQLHSAAGQPSSVTGTAVVDQPRQYFF